MMWGNSGEGGSGVWLGGWLGKKYGLGLVGWLR